VFWVDLEIVDDLLDDDWVIFGIDGDVACSLIFYWFW